MEPMKPMAPMKPMEPMAPPEQWWPDNLGDPTTTGSQNTMRYAVFPKDHRLLIEDDGKVTTYDTADHKIGGVSQSSHGQSLTFTSQSGPVDLESLIRLD